MTEVDYVEADCPNCFVTYDVPADRDSFMDLCPFCKKNADCREQDHLRLMRVIEAMPLSKACYLPDILELMCRVFAADDPRFQNLNRSFSDE